MFSQAPLPHMSKSEIFLLNILWAALYISRHRCPPDLVPTNLQFPLLINGDSILSDSNSKSSGSPSVAQFFTHPTLGMPGNLDLKPSHFLPQWSGHFKTWTRSLFSSTPAQGNTSPFLWMLTLLWICPCISPGSRHSNFHVNLGYLQYFLHYPQKCTWLPSDPHKSSPKWDLLGEKVKVKK